MERQMKRKCYSEFIGTFILVFVGTGAVVMNDVSGGAITHVGIAICFGLVVMAMIHTLGEISGAHINPAVTVAFWLANRFEGREVLPYVASQIAGGLAASTVLLLMFPEHLTLGATLPAGTDLQSFVLEIILTFILMFVIITVSVGSKEQGLLAGITIGAVVGFEAMFAGPISGASMNPARSIGPALMSGQLQSLWLYIVAPMLGAALAITTCRLIQWPGCCADDNPIKEKCSKEESDR